MIDKSGIASNRKTSITSFLILIGLDAFFRGLLAAACSSSMNIGMDSTEKETAQTLSDTQERSLVFMTHTTNFKRILCLLLACLVLTSTIITPVAASPYLLYEAIAATARNAIASLIRALGVYVSDGIENTLSQGLETWESLVDIIVSRLPDEFLYTNAAMEVFVRMITKDGLYYVDRNLVETVADMLVNTFETKDGELIVPVGYGFPSMEAWQVNEVNAILEDCKQNGYYYSSYIRKMPYCCFIDFSPASENAQYLSPIVVFSTDEETEATYNPNSGYLKIYIPSGSALMLYNDSSGGRGHLRSSSAGEWEFSLTVNGATVLNYEGETTVNITDTFGYSVDSVNAEAVTAEVPAAWDSKSVAVAEKDTDKVITGLPLSVPTSTGGAATTPWENVTSGTQVDTETEAIPDTNTGTEVIPDTDVETQAGFWATLWGWLEKIWTAIKSLATAIAQPIVNAIAAVKAQVVALVNFFTGTVTVASPLQAIRFNALFDLFPFNIPYGIYQAVTLWGSSAEPPVIRVPLPNYSGGSVSVYEFEINFAEIPGMDKLATIIRAGELILFVLGLALITRKVTKW